MEMRIVRAEIPAGSVMRRGEMDAERSKIQRID